MKSEKPPGTSYESILSPEIVLTFHCSSGLKNFENSQPSASNFKSFSRSLEQFFLTVGQNNFGNKIPILLFQHGRQIFLIASHTIYENGFSNSRSDQFWLKNTTALLQKTRAEPNYVLKYACRKFLGYGNNRK